MGADGRRNYEIDLSGRGRLCCWSLDPVAGAGDPATPRGVGILHGLGDHAGRYGHVGAALAARGFAVRALDLPGHGKSYGKRGHVLSWTDFRASVTNLPNLLTMGRVAAIPAVLYFMDNFSPARSFIACLIYIGAAVTDYLDGWLARRRKQVSLLGKFLDPLADKLIVSATLVYATAMGRCPAWLVVALLARDLAITGLRSLAAAEGLIIAASQEGKQKTAFQMTGTIFLLIHFRYKILFVPVTLDFSQVGLWTLYVSLVLSIISAVNYVRLFVRALYAPRAS